MKPIWCINLTNNRKNEEMNGREFLAVAPSLALSQTLDKTTEQAEATETKAKLPLAFRLVRDGFGVLAAIWVISTLKSLRTVSLTEGYHNAPWLFWIGGACLAIYGLLKLISMQREKAVLSTEESERTFANLESVAKSVYAELGVPDNAKEVDVFSFYYKEKDGKIKVCEKGLQMAPYLNPVFSAFSDGTTLYLANLEGKFAFPLTDCVAIHSIKKHIRVASWNKSINPNKGIYKPYKLTTDQYGCVHCQYYHILEVRRNGETWGLYFPNYELPTFEALTGLKALPLTK